jgi:hypothetical protein
MARVKWITFRVSDAEMEEITKEAEEQARPVSQFARLAVLDAARGDKRRGRRSPANGSTP